MHCCSCLSMCSVGPVTQRKFSGARRFNGGNAVTVPERSCRMATCPSLFGLLYTCKNGKIISLDKEATKSLVAKKCWAKGTETKSQLDSFGLSLTGPASPQFLCLGPRRKKVHYFATREPQISPHSPAMSPLCRYKEKSKRIFFSRKKNGGVMAGTIVWTQGAYDWLLKILPFNKGWK